MAKQPEAVAPTLPAIVTMSDADDIPAYADHLYAGTAAKFKAKLGTWEQHALAVEQGRAGFVAWYRNPTGGERALRIPFERGEGFGKAYPDFVFFHEDDAGEVQASIVDPHGQHLSDAGPKLRGLADYAEKHGDEYARVISIIKRGDDFLFLDMADATVRAALADVGTKEEIEAAFASHGAKYG